MDHCVISQFQRCRNNDDVAVKWSESIFHSTTQFLIYDRPAAMLPDSIGNDISSTRSFSSLLADSSAEKPLHQITRESINSASCQQYYQHAHEEAYYPPFVIPTNNVTECFPRVPEPGERSIRSAVN